ncbi:hypothetical protein SAMN02745724_04459 [Pseudoalteromonas denitrificans DSM 6059]|uniref:Uncharacterized protein n=1 Tax=Pseudoalteromonas denitrificans DSM 6059 TaxID=1123010 RepID=A0A1I1S4Q4_9GAMM|nr:hypothetical protein SAMN02745724_04459 [Pseudoalteromonas denitrificans DSM 6059]
MSYLLLFLMMVTGCLFIYLTNKHQILISKKLNTYPWRTIGVILLFSALPGWLNLFSLSAAILFWLALSLLLFGFMPFIALFLNRK